MPRIFPKKEFKSHLVLSAKFPKKVITHAVSNEKTFLKILQEGKIKLPKQLKDEKKKTPKMEEILGVNNHIYLSAGFDYNTTFHHWPFGFLFSLKTLEDRQFIIFKTYLISQSWIIFLKYLKENDSVGLMNLRNLNKRTQREIDIFLKKGVCSFWEIEKELSDCHKKHKDKAKILRILMDYKKKMEVSNSQAPHFIRKHYLDPDNIRRIEIISTKPIYLNHKEFLGVYIEKSKIKKMLPKIRTYLDKDKIVFDGRKII